MGRRHGWRGYEWRGWVRKREVLQGRRGMDRHGTESTGEAQHGGQGVASQG